MIEQGSFNPRVAMLLVVAAFGLPGCILGGRSSRSASPPEETPRSEAKVRVDAYLFDVKFKHNGKRRSVRLDIFFADSIALFSARAYLGKGVAKGVWRPDSSLFYFPTEKEYYSGPLDELTQAGCANGGDLQRLAPVLLSGRLLLGKRDSSVHIDRRTKNKIEAHIAFGTCETPVTLVFDKQGGSPFSHDLFYLKEFSYVPADGKGRVVGKRRILKRGKGLERRKFKIEIPSDAVAVQW